MITGCLVFTFSFCGCSKQEQSSKEESTSSEDAASTEENASGENFASAAETASGEKSKSKESGSINQGVNGKLFVKLEKLEKLASEYKKENPDNMDSAVLLVAKYLRSGNENYLTTDWNMLAGNPDEGFEAYVEQNGDGLETFRDNATVVDPGTKKEIEFSHLMASVNLAIRQTTMNSDIEEPYVDYGSWVGDLLQLCREIKEDGVDSSSWKEEMVSKIGDEDSYFNQDDLYADLDACNIKEFFEKDMSLSQAFYEYYYKILEKTNTTRYQYFYKNHFDGVTSEKELAQKMKAIFQNEDSLIPRALVGTEGLNFTEDADLIDTACEALAQKIAENQ